MHRLVIAIAFAVVFVPVPARADKAAEVRVGFGVALGPGSLDEVSEYQFQAPHSSVYPMAYRLAMTVGVDDWALELAVRGLPLDQNGLERTMMVFEPALRQDVGRLGPLRGFVRADLMLGRVLSETRPGPCGFDGCITEHIFGESAFGVGVGAGVELGTFVDRGYLALTAIATRDIVVVGGDTGFVTTYLFGFSVGPGFR